MKRIHHFIEIASLVISIYLLHRQGKKILFSRLGSVL